MTEKQYKLEKWTSSSLYYSFPDGNLHHSIGEVIARVENDLNSLYNENEQLKQTVSDWSGSYDELFEDVKRLEEENEQLKKQNENLQNLIDALERQLKICEYGDFKYE